ncbi:hypothetical protein SJR91_17025, partial [Aeromonas caviae]|uniref:hypothetical protein n=1 Tax=Aeromonas caviae TaxID=648 RepID=UPI0029DC0399
QHFLSLACRSPSHNCCNGRFYLAGKFFSADAVISFLHVLAYFFSRKCLESAYLDRFFAI